MGESEKKYWLGFSAFPGIGPLRFKLLISYFGCAQNAWNASKKEFLEIGMGEKLTAKFDHFRRTFLLADYAKDIEKKNIKVITIKDKTYPKLLAQISDAPFLIYVRGDISVLDEVRPRIGVVGTRKITGYGEQVTRKIVEGLVDYGITVVSGLAYGVDTVAHETAVLSKGKTIAVLGCGVDIVYPVSNSTLYWTIIKKKFGCIISEFPPGMITDKGLFPARNRIISGLSLGVVVTEGAKDSGALITARYAAEQGREVFAVPGPITSRMSDGPTILLKQGAKMVTEASDILGELHIRPIRQINQIGNTGINQNFTRDEIRIVEILQNESLHFDEIVKKSCIPPAKLGSILTMMEMKKLINNQGGGVYGITK